MASVLDHVNSPWVLPVVCRTYILCRTSGRVDDACCAGSRFRRLVESVSERVLLAGMQRASKYLLTHIGIRRVTLSSPSRYSQLLPRSVAIIATRIRRAHAIANPVDGDLATVLLDHTEETMRTSQISRHVEDWPYPRFD